MAFETGIRIKIDSRGARAGARQVRGALRSIGPTARRAATAITGAFDRVRRTLFSLKTLVGGVFVGLAVRKVIGEFADFERGLIGVGKTTGIAGRELSDLGEGIQQLAFDLPISTNELLEIGQAAGQLGVKGAGNILKFTETVGQLGLASDLAGAAAATSLARILTVTGTAVGEVDRLGSVIVELGNNFAATEAEIAGITTRIAQATAQFRLTAAEVAGIGTALKAIGVEAEAGGTVVGRAFQSINDAIRGGGKEMEVLIQLTGMTGTALKKNFFTDPVPVFLAFVKGLNAVASSGGDLTAAMAAIGLEGIRVVQALGAIAIRSDVLEDALNTATAEWLENTALVTEATIAATSYSAQMQLLDNVVGAAASTIGGELTPFIAAATLLLRDFIIKAREAGDLKRFGAKVVDFVEAIALGIAGAVDAMSAAFDFIGAGFNKILAGFNRLPRIIQEIGILGFFMLGIRGKTVLLFAVALVDEIAIIQRRFFKMQPKPGEALFETTLFGTGGPSRLQLVIREFAEEVRAKMAEIVERREEDALEAAAGGKTLLNVELATAEVLAAQAKARALAVKALKDQARELERIKDLMEAGAASLRELIANLRFENELIGLTGEERKRATTLRRAEEIAKRAGIDLDSTTLSQIKEQLDVQEQLNEELRKRNALEEARRSAIGGGTTAGAPLKSTIGGVFVGGFAHGGSFTVPPSSSGQPDGTLVSFLATPRETVTIAPPPGIAGRARTGRDAAGERRMEFNLTIHAPGADAGVAGMIERTLRKFEQSLPAIALGAMEDLDARS